MKKLALAVTLTLFCLSVEGQAQISTADLLLEDNTGAPLVTLSAPSSGSAYSFLFPSAPGVFSGATGGLLFVSSALGSDMQTSLLLPGTDGQTLQLDNGVPAWKSVNTLPGGTTMNATLIWNGTNWVENTNVTLTPSGDIFNAGNTNTTGNTTVGGDLTVTGDVILGNGVINNNELENDDVTITAGTGLSGGGTVALGGTITLNNDGILDVVGTTNQVNVAKAAGVATLSTPQDIHTGASPTFNGMTLTGLTGPSAATDLVVSNGGVLETIPISSLPSSGAGEPYVTFGAGSANLTNNRIATAGTGITIVDAGTDNGSLTINNTGLLGAAAGTGISVSTAGQVATIENTGVTNISVGTGLSATGSTGAITLTNTGITSVVGTPNQVNVSTVGGVATLSTPQDIHTGASPIFNGMTLTGLTNDNTVTSIVVSDGGVLKTRAVTSLPGGFTGVTTDNTLTGLGILGNVLGIDLANPNTWTGAQTFGVMSTTGNTTLGNGGDNVTVDATTGQFVVDGLTQDNTLTDILVQDANGRVFTRDVSSISGGSSGWALTGNAGTAPATNFLGTTDAQPLVIRSNNVERARVLSSGPMQLTSTAGATGELRFQEPTTGGTDYSSFEAQPQSGNIRYILPDSAGIVGDVLNVTSVSGSTITLDWASANATGGTGSVLFARKTADEAKTAGNPSVLEDDDHLSLSLEANTTYKIEATMFISGAGNSDKIDIAIDVPTGSTVLFGLTGFADKSGNSNTGNGIRDADAAGSTTSNSYTAIGLNSNATIIHLSGLIITGNNAGDADLMWISDGSNTTLTMKKNSIFSAEVID